jgi:Deoxyribodipyrimidine photo-lyase-related protein.
MRSYRDSLIANKIKVHYEELNIDNSISYLDSLKSYIKKNNVKSISLFDVEDKWLKRN